MDKRNDKKIVDSWRKNASPWVVAVQEKQIESRRLITDQAIVDVFKSISAESVLDIGCGEGWLMRMLSSLGMSVTGLDVVPELLDEAEKRGGGEFLEMAYEEISSTRITNKFDAAVCNFSLLGKESVEHIFNVLPGILNEGGYFIVQTLHPIIGCEPHGYKDAWREGSWAGFSEDFCDPPPWYFRTMTSWFRLFRDYGYELIEIREPINPQTGVVASLIMIARVNT